MFYSQFILAKKGPLGTIWIAAHLERKLRKNQVADTDIGVSVDSILSPEVPIALRLSSHLLLGVVRIYSKKVNYLFDDCSEALLKVKQAFRSTAVDLPPEQSKAPYHSITLPETFDLEDFEIPDNEVFQGNYVDHHVSAREQITLQDTLDGVAFTTSQFGPDERFGDGDASQIGLELEEDLFLDKNEAAGTSGVQMDMDVDPLAPAKASSPFNDDDHNEGDLDPSLAASANNFSIQAPSTPGLVEEPNLPTAQALVSDDHMDEDHSPSEFAAKEVYGPSTSKAEPPHFGNDDFHANGSCHQQDEQDGEKARSLGVEVSAETVELFSSGNTQPLVSNEHVEATNGLDSLGNVVNGNPVENESNMAADVPFEGHSSQIFTPFPDIASDMEVHSFVPCAGSDKSDLNGVYSLMSETKSENIPPVGSEVPNLGETDLVVVNSGFEPQNEGEPHANLELPGTFESNINKRLSAPTMPVLQSCNLPVQHTFTEVDNLVNTSNIPAENDRLGSLGISAMEDSTNEHTCTEGGFLVNTSNIPAEYDRLCSLGISAKEDSTNVSGISADVQDAMKTNLCTDQPTHHSADAENNYVDGNLDNKITVENNIEKENDSKTSDLPAIEKLLSMPNLSAGHPDDFFVESTPVQENVVEVDRDATADKGVSGRKRSYTESTLTVQSLNSVDSSGVAQSKRSVEMIPDDDDLLSSILAGRKSTTLKMKPTPPVTDTVPAKRQRVAARTSAYKRKVLVDDAMVLHGDMIRQQLTNTEDIRRVRKKAPCTRLEIWMLQKQFIEDQIFSEPVFTGMSASLISLHFDTFDLRRTKIVEKSKGANEVDTSAKATHGQEAEYVGTVVSSAANDGGDHNHEGSVEAPSHQRFMLGIDGSSPHEEIKTVEGDVSKDGSEYMYASAKATLGQGAEYVGTIPSAASDDGYPNRGGSLETPSHERSMLGIDGSSLQEEIKTVDNEVSKEGSEYQASGTKVEMEVGNGRVLLGGEAMGTDLACATGPVSEVNFNLAADTTANISYINEIGDDSVHIDTSFQLLDERSEMHPTKEGGSTSEDVCGAGTSYQEGEHTTEKLGLDTKLDAKCLSEETSGVEKIVTRADTQDHSLFHDITFSGSVPFKGEAHPTSDQVTAECQLGEFVPLDNCSLPVHDNLLALDHRDDGSAQTSKNVVEGLKLDSSCSVEADLSSQNTIITERENIACWDADPKMVMDSAAVNMDYIYPGEHADYGTDAVEHDTDFLNVDDDDDAEDYESDMPNADGKRILDNTGWSARTRAVANYLQVLFEKEAQQGKADVSLDNLLTGKSRKEAARMFFETLVLKTKDYIQAEQESSFGDIRINPKGKLLTSDF